MKKIFYLLFLLSSFALTFHPLNHETFVAKDSLPSSCLIKLNNGGHGSGSLVKLSDGRVVVLTAAHVASFSIWEVICGALNLSVIKKKISQQTLVDLAVLEIDQSEEVKKIACEIDPTMPKIGDKEILWTAGFGKASINTRVDETGKFLEKISGKPLNIPAQTIGSFPSVVEYPFGISALPISFFTSLTNEDDKSTHVALVGGDSGAGVYRKKADGSFLLVGIASNNAGDPTKTVPLSTLKSMIIPVAPYLDFLLNKDKSSDGKVCE